MKNINIFGSTGIIGSKCLYIAKNYFPNININLLVANKNYSKLAKQIQEYKPNYAKLYNLYNFITLRKPRCILEFGTGFSTIGR